MPMRTTDLDILEKNIRALADRCQEQDIPLRLHTKTHKIPEIAKMQLEAGAIGIVSQKVGEAEALVAAGIKDILIPYNIIGKQKVDRLAALCNQATMTVFVDCRKAWSRTKRQLECWSSAIRAAIVAVSRRPKQQPISAHSSTAFQGYRSR